MQLLDLECLVRCCCCCRCHLVVVEVVVRRLLGFHLGDLEGLVGVVLDYRLEVVRHYYCDLV